MFAEDLVGDDGQRRDAGNLVLPLAKSCEFDVQRCAAVFKKFLGIGLERLLGQIPNTAGRRRQRHLRFDRALLRFKRPNALRQQPDLRRVGAQEVLQDRQLRVDSGNLSAQLVSRSGLLPALEIVSSPVLKIVIGQIDLVCAFAHKRSPQQRARRWLLSAHVLAERCYVLQHLSNDQRLHGEARAVRLRIPAVGGGPEPLSGGPASTPITPIELRTE